MGVPNLKVGYTSAMPRREDHEVHKDMRGHWGEKKGFSKLFIPVRRFLTYRNFIS